jgi:hypothetical protein
MHSEPLVALSARLRSPVKIVDFHNGDTFVPFFDGIKDILEIQFIVQLCSSQFKVYIYGIFVLWE